MNFYEIGPRDNFASYRANDQGQSIDDARIIPPHRVVATRLQEYLGNPPRKPAKQGALHSSGSQYFVRADALPLFESAARGRLQTKPVTIEGREHESFFQVWVTNFVDCLDMANTVASPSGGFYKGKIGVIKRAAFDECRWDGSDLFVVPQDPSYAYFCTESFVEAWKASKLKGIKFSRYLMDPAAINC